jgi:hypothetical protein
MPNSNELSREGAPFASTVGRIEIMYPKRIKEVNTFKMTK